MTVTVAQLCKLPLFEKSIVLIAGSGGLLRQVQYVTVIDSPMVPIPKYNLDDNVFVITSFALYKDNPQLMCESVRNLAQKQISALAVKTGVYLQRIPDEVKEICEELNLPLFDVIDRGLPCRKIISAVNTEIIDHRFQLIQDLNEQNEQLFNTILNGESIDFLIKMMGNNLRRNCACASRDGRLLALYKVPGSDPHDKMGAIVEKMIDNSFAFPAPKGAERQYFSCDDFQVFPCIVYNNIEGFFLIEHPGPLDLKELSYSKQMVSFLSIKLMEELLVAKKQQDITAAIIDEVLFQQIQSEETIKQRLSLLGFIPNANYRVLAFSAADQGRQKSFFAQKVLWNSISAFLNNLFPGVVSYHVDGTLVAIISFSATSKYSNDKCIHSALKMFLTGSPLLEHVVAGFGKTQQNLQNIPGCYKDTKQTVRLGKVFAPEARVYSYDSFAQARIVSHVLNTPEMDRIMNTVVIPIHDYDLQHKSDLWKTLETCLSLNNLESSAAALHIHPSTLRYRFQKIAAITDQNYFTTEGRFVLSVASIISKLI